MAPKRPPPVEDPPAASSSDDDEVNSSDDVDDEADSSSSEEEEQHPEPTKPSSAPPPPPPPPQAAKKVSPQTASASESQTESDSESDSDVDRSNVKPIASKPMSDAAPAKRLKATTPSTPSKAAASTASKKVSETDSKTIQSKNKEKEVSAITNDSSGDPNMKKPLFQRIWSEEDEISILQGMLDFSLKKRNPINDVDDFHEYIKKSLHIDATRSQLLDKMKRLRKKYQNNFKKFKEGEPVTFSKPHEQKVYQISKKIWSGEGTSGAIWESPMKPNGTARKANKGTNKGSKSTVELKSDLISIPPAKRNNEKEKNTVSDVNGNGNVECITGKRKSIASSGIEEYVLNEGLYLVDTSKKVELEKKWKTLQGMELEVFVRRMELMTEQAKLVLAANKTANN